MARLIDARRRERILQGFAGHLLEAGKTEAAEAVNTIIKGLKLEPTVDAVPVVRCRDCVLDNTTSCPLCWIEKHTLQFVNHDPDFFCADGERKDNA